MPRSLLAQIDERAEAIGLSRSQYLSQLARQDLVERGTLELREQPVSYKTGKPNSVQAVEDEIVGEISKGQPSKKIGKPK